MIYLPLLLVVVLVVLSQVSLRHVLDKITYDLVPSKEVVEPGEPFTFTTQIENKKLLPVAFLKMAELVPLQMDTTEEKGLYRESNISRITSTTYLLPYQRYHRVRTGSIGGRGRYFFRGAVLYGGDLFGFKETVEYVDMAKEVVVLPKAIDCGNLDRVMGGFIGDLSVNRFIMEDPVLTLGFREYTGREPMKQINWGQSLKAGNLMVRSFDHTQDLSVSVVLNVECGADGKGVVSEKIEGAFSVTRAVCQYLENKKIKYSFVTNATAAGAIGQWSTAPEGLGTRHLYNILEGLGRATYDSTENFALLLSRVVRGAEQGRAHIVITPEVQPYWQGGLAALNSATGGNVRVISSEIMEKEGA